MKYKIDLHTHTVASGHAYSTIEEYIQRAVEYKMEIIGISDHAPEMPGGAHEFYFYNLKVLPNEVKGVKILKGVELNILDNKGRVDTRVDDLNNLDYAIASLHPPCINPGDIEYNTNAIINAMKNPNVNIIGHPDDGRYPLYYEKIVKEAKETNTILEINNSSLNPDVPRKGARNNYIELLKYAQKYNAYILLGSDAHVSYDLGNFNNSIKVIKEAKIDKSLVLNDKPIKLLDILRRNKRT